MAHHSAMKHLFAVIGLTLSALAAHAAVPQPDLITQIHFAGAPVIGANPHASAFTNEFTSSEALALRAKMATSLSRWLSGWLQTNLNAAVPDGAAKLRPLFDDLQWSEFALQIWAMPDGQSETAVVIKLDPARAQLWQTNLKPFFSKATFNSSGGWLVFDSNPALQKAGDKLAKNIAATGTNWLDLYVNWPGLAQWHHPLKELGLPATEFHVTALGNNLNTVGKFEFPSNLALNLEPWHVPTNTIHAPFDSFTAVRGFATWLQSQSWAPSLQLSPMPNQLFLWSLPALPFQSYAAAPVPNASTAVSQAYAHLQMAISGASARGDLMTPAKVEMSSNAIAVTGVPFLAMHAQSVTEPAGQFLVAGLFPNPPQGLPLPPGLFDRLATKNLVFYHWESTADRIPQLLQMTQLGLMLTRHKQLDGKSAAYKWLRKAGATKGTTETGITQTGPAEFTFLRQGPGLFTAIELFTLANWLEATNFPGCDLKAPAQLQSMTVAQPSAPSAAPAPKAAR